MLELSSVVKNLTPEQEALFRRHKANVRRAFIQAASDIGGSHWREADDAALDAATLWLYQRSAETYGSPTVASLFKPLPKDLDDILSTEEMAKKLAPEKK